jgi:hypothetical protein
LEPSGYTGCHAHFSSRRDPVRKREEESYSAIGAIAPPTNLAEGGFLAVVPRPWADLRGKHSGTTVSPQERASLGYVSGYV